MVNFIICELCLNNNNFLRSNKRWLLEEAELKYLCLNVPLSLFLLKGERFDFGHDVFASFRNS